MSAPLSLTKGYVGAEYQNYLESQSRKETCSFFGPISKGDSGLRRHRGELASNVIRKETCMTSSLATSSSVKPPKEMQYFFDEAPLIGNERSEEFEELFVGIANAIKPTDFISWQCVGRITDLSWYIRRERILKNEIIKFYHKQVAAELLDCFHNPMVGIPEEIRRWEYDPTKRKEVNQRLAEKGHLPDSVLAQAYMRGAAEIDAIDRRIGSHELRTILILKEVRIYSARLARQIDKARSGVIESALQETSE
jgi:hypothetical protein